MSSVTSRDHPSAVLKATTRTGLEYATADLADDIPFGGVGFIGFDICATKWVKVIEHQTSDGRDLVEAKHQLEELAVILEATG